MCAVFVFVYVFRDSAFVRWRCMRMVRMLSYHVVFFVFVHHFVLFMYFDVVFVCVCFFFFFFGFVTDVFSCVVLCSVIGVFVVCVMSLYCGCVFCFVYWVVFRDMCIVIV